MQYVCIVFEYAEYTNKIIGVFKSDDDALKCHAENKTHRYIQREQIK